MEESHPVPQDITSFEFHLVGDMTLKQFTYLASGLAISYLVFVFLAKPFPYISWPIIVLSALIGTCYAFLPIAERPLDHWTMAFLRAIFTPTKRTYKSKIVSADNPNFNNRLDIYLNSVSAPSIPQPAMPPHPQTIPQTRPQQATPTQSPILPPSQPVQPSPSTQPNPTPPSNLPTPQDLKKAVDLAKEAQEIQSKIVEDEKKLEAIKEKAAEPGSDPSKFTRQFDSVLSDLRGLNNEASDVSKQLADLSKSNSPASPAPVKAPLRIVPTLSLTSIPNIINGIITDAQGGYLDNAIVVAHDKTGIPVRALKSNKLGQFITATPLPDGIYTLTTEKESLNFPSYEVELKGEVLQPIVISAQKGNV